MVDRGYLVRLICFCENETDYDRFAMLTGYPPFQSTTQDEIYRRVKSVEYKWPKDKECMNDIPDEAKDLVACLLRVNAEERPDLDRIVGHPFFSMHGGNAIPLVLGNGCRTSKPPWLEAKSPRGDVMKKDSQLLALATLAKNCGVGHLDGFDQAFEVVGGKIELSLYKECLEEEIARTYPIVPLPIDMVYTGKPDRNGSWAKQASTLRSCIPAASKSKSPKPSSVSATEVDELQMNLPETRQRRTIPSYASTLRAPPYTTLRSRAINKSTAPSALTLSQATVPSKVQPRSTYPNRPNRGLLNELPVRSTSNPTTAVAAQPRAKLSGRVTRSQSANVIPISATSSKDSISTADQPETISPDPDDAKRPRAAPQKSRVVTRRNESQGLVVEKSPKRSVPPLGRRVATKNPKKRLLLSPDEVAECIPGTNPKDVARDLRQIRAELDSAINGDCSVAGEIDHSIRDQKKRLNGRLLITKWVDYTNKFGIGYILANGTVGCLFKADSSAPQSGVVVAGAEAHLRNRKCAAYAQKDQIVPQAGAPVEFLEDCAADGMKRVLVQAATYLIKDGTTGLEERKIPGETMYDYEKRKRLNIWDKFAKYMTQNLGKDVTAPLNEEPSRHALHTDKYTIAGPFVKFYQRLGNVGIWGFGDGSFQFNFPDHTKLIISGDGSWLDFYHLPIQAAHILKRGAPLSADTLATRGCLSYPPAVMARGIYQNEDFRTIIETNDLIVKLGFVTRVVGAWLNAGGLGALGEEDKFLKWDGASEGDIRFIWVSIGAMGGDTRYELD
jgi:serine/threonine protein kinase